MNIPDKLQKSILKLTSELRDEFKITVGKIYRSVEEALEHIDGCLCIVGDESSKRAITFGRYPEIIVIDYRTRREFPKNEYIKFFSKVGTYERFYVVNPPGTITPELWRCLHRVMEAVNAGMRAMVIVDGEEDLVSIPMIVLLPKGWYLMYGMPGMGVQTLYIDDDIRERALKALHIMMHEASKG